MKTNVVLAMLILSFVVLPLAFAVDVPTLYQIDGYSTINSYVQTGRTSQPNFVYFNGKLLESFGTFGIDTNPSGGDKTYMSEYSGTWGPKWEILSGMAHNGWPPVMVAWNSYIIGIALDNARPYGSNCKPLLVYSSNGGHSWTSGGYLSAKGAYSYAFYGVVTDDGAIVFTGWSSPSTIYSWVCPSGSSPLVNSNYQIGSSVPTSADEPSVVELAPKGSGHLLMAFRQTSGVGWATSTDYGANWGNVHTLLSSPAAPQALVRLSWSPDRIMLGWNNAGIRDNLCLAISETSGTSWGNPFQIASISSEGGGHPCYPWLTMCGSNIAVGYWVTDVTGQGGTGTGELTRCAILTQLGGGTTYSVTVNAYCNNQSTVLNVKIYLDGVDTGHLTPYTIPNLSNTHTIQVESVDVHGHPFQYWDNPPIFALLALSDSITVSGDSSHTAYYDVTLTPVLQWPFMVLFGVGAVALVGGLYVSRWRLHLPKTHIRRRRRHK